MTRSAMGMTRGTITLFEVLYPTCTIHTILRYDTIYTLYRVIYEQLRYVDMI